VAVNPVVCRNSIEANARRSAVEVDQSAEPFASLDPAVQIRCGLRAFEHRVPDALVVPFEPIVLYAAKAGRRDQGPASPRDGPHRAATTRKRCRAAAGRSGEWTAIGATRGVPPVAEAREQLD
jgi:hypothetical protein